MKTICEGAKSGVIHHTTDEWHSLASFKGLIRLMTK